MTIDSIYKNRRVFLTGATGFKGSWLAYWLQQLGAIVCGFSKNIPTEPNHFSLLDIRIEDHRDDINDFIMLRNVLKKFEPEIVFHLAAQPLVRFSYDNPLETFSTNIIGTANLLQSITESESVRAVIVITTDKVYKPQKHLTAYCESDQLGGYDPYSASKACAELVVDSFRQSFFATKKTLLATARAGNVVGGGDWANGRLIPDLVRATIEGKTTTIRMPNAIRPWQHVLEPLHGYLLLGQYLLEGKGEFATSWNFGPAHDENHSVKEIVQLAKNYWDKINFEIIPNNEKHEENFLMLDSNKSRTKLGWKPIWTLEQGIEQTIKWYRNFYEKNQIQTLAQIKKYSQ
ncbi:MAG: CDP-glucose 4,6-dehydratase [Planctomycetaceae bacterium]|jgi:CDP-glucose 4,6-dehydratase|nr:CDP-glucose 4,6-dehydratase [Planctomycetaceae bacterium]